MKKFIVESIFAVVFLALVACDNGSSSDEEAKIEQPVFEYGTLVDSRDQAVYKTIRIGSQNWMAENLRYAYFDNDEVSCQDGLSSKCDSLGRFYTWAEAMDTLNTGCGNNFYLTCTLGKYAVPKHFRGICPEGWRIPTVEDWNTLIEYAGGPDSAGIKLLARDKWREGTDSYGFNALRISYPLSSDFCRSHGEISSLWGVSEQGAHGIEIGNNVFIWDGLGDLCYQRNSIRCIEGESNDMPPQDSYKTEYNDSVLVDKRDGHTYKVVAIGNEVWMAENLNYVYNDGVQSVCDKDDTVDCQKYGRLYTWTGAMGLESDYGDSIGVFPYPHQGVCPEGWHIPSVDEFKKLIEASGGYTADVNGMYLSGAALRSVDGWGEEGDGTDLLGFSAIPVGKKNYSTGFWSDRAKVIDFFQSFVLQPYCLKLTLNKNVNTGKQDQFSDTGMDLNSVRCVKD